MHWYQVLDALVEQLREGLTGCLVIRSAAAKVPDRRTVIVRRGPMAVTRAVALRNTEFTVLVECWEYDPDPGEADRRLAELEELTVAQINALIRAQRQTGLELNATYTVQPDGDLFRPSVGSEMSIDFRVRERRPTTPM